MLNTNSDKIDMVYLQEYKDIIENKNINSID